ncbi:MAG TPA: hypothetical protein VLT47_10965 [Anaeromyxobacteraceae bacterium]|nr:hypothetical protein [Anaeromyxobacteraceae bacterium]
MNGREEQARQLALAASTLAQAVAAIERGDAAAAELSLAVVARIVGFVRIDNAHGQPWERMVQDWTLRGT